MPRDLWAKCPECIRTRAFDWLKVVYQNNLILAKCPKCGTIIVVGCFSNDD